MLSLSAGTSLLVWHLAVLGDDPKNKFTIEFYVSSHLFRALFCLLLLRKNTNNIVYFKKCKIFTCLICRSCNMKMRNIYIILKPSTVYNNSLQ